ncbi:MAG: ATP-binding cassette domain-containing protein [Betaproteobacteria bacterium]|nr:ATP-binding cassette domain-containing protein [Betaproteobacteria bacterium]
MVQPAINVEGLYKEYLVGAEQTRHTTLYDLLSHSILAPIQRWRKLAGSPDTSNRFWALRDVNFKVQPGDVLGIVGRNGAGKSTLLKILSRITAPTRGRISVRGRMASLLEVGTGFHPELSGRENIYLNATILGMGRAEIQRKFDDIVSFSGVERFLDTPVKRYSSGMYVRLAFAVAAHVEADILLVDEVLAVGDAEFQKRCLGVMGDIARVGRTVLFVSHNLTALRNLCTTGLLLQDGQAAAFGPVGEVLNQYASTRTSSQGTLVKSLGSRSDRLANLRSVAVAPVSREHKEQLSIGTSFAVCTQVEIHQSDKEVGVFLHCHDSNQNRVFSTGSFFNPSLNGRKLEAGLHTFKCVIPGHLLNDGEYTLDVMLVHNRTDVIATESEIVSFRIHDEPLGVEGWNWPPVGVIRPRLAWSHTVE